MVCVKLIGNFSWSRRKITQKLQQLINYKMLQFTRLQSFVIATSWLNLYVTFGPKNVRLLDFLFAFAFLRYQRLKFISNIKAKFSQAKSSKAFCMLNANIYFISAKYLSIFSNKFTNKKTYCLWDKIELKIHYNLSRR